jgi:hypothetical protein
MKRIGAASSRSRNPVAAAMVVRRQPPYEPWFRCITAGSSAQRLIGDTGGEDDDDEDDEDDEDDGAGGSGDDIGARYAGHRGAEQHSCHDSRPRPLKHERPGQPHARCTGRRPGSLHAVPEAAPP